MSQTVKYVVMWRRFEYYDPCGRNEYSTQSEKFDTFFEAAPRARHLRSMGLHGVAMRKDTSVPIADSEWVATDGDEETERE